MTTEIVTITHENAGIRVHWPDSTTSMFANQIYLAEAYVTAMRSRAAAGKAITTTVVDRINKVDKLLEGDASKELLSEAVNNLRDGIMAAAMWLG